MWWQKEKDEDFSRVRFIKVEFMVISFSKTLLIFFSQVKLKSFLKEAC